jgi:site-specific DNA recombinase
MKKRAILYIRVSTDEQADKGYSLAHQKERLEKYCELQGYEIVALYNDDHSAKSFERPQFKKLLEYVKKNKNKADLLIFTKWDRFSRNAGDAYGMINTLNKLGIEPQAIEQPLDLAVPENKLMLAFYLAAPEVENDRRALNVIVGMRKAKREGRFIGKAPKGYINLRNERGIARIELVPEEAKHIKWVFNEIAKGKKCLEDIRKEVNTKGLVIQKSYFAKMIRYPLYCGLIEVSKYKDEEAMLVQGQHTPIITKSLFETVQDIINGRKRNVPTTNRQKDEFPLRGFLECNQCGSPLTASASKGNGGFYNYYHCQKGCGERLKAEIANNSISKLIENISSKQVAINLVKSYSKTIFSKSSIFKKENTQTLKTEITKIENRINQAQQLMLDGELNIGDYKSIKERYEPELRRLQSQIIELGAMSADIKTYMDFNLELLSKLSQYYVIGDVHTKQLLLGSIFSKKIVFENNQYRTIPYNEVVSLIMNVDKALADCKTKKALQDARLSAEVGMSTSISNFWVQDLLLFEAFNKCIIKV